MTGGAPIAGKRRSLSRRVAGALVVVAVGASATLLGAPRALDAVRWLVARSFSDVLRIEAENLARLIDASSVALLDARTPEEFAVSHLCGAVRVDPQRPDLSLRGVDRALPIVVYCSVGYRSARVARALLAAGHRDVRNLDGGVFAWVNDGRPVYRGDRVVAEVHPYDAWWGLLLRGARRVRAVAR